MESNGKAVTVDGEEINYDIGEIDFGEPGTNGQHSFFQLLHMGQVVPVVRSPIHLPTRPPRTSSTAFEPPRSPPPTHPPTSFPIQDFIGFAESQKELHVQGEELSSHDELMCNFFAQPDALAIGKTAQELLAEGVPPALVSHRTFKGTLLF